jgi:hypothetical protein
VSDLSYAPTFVHTDWLDNIDRVEAGGPSGLNARLHAIESDLHQVSTVVDQINAEITKLEVPGPPPGTHRLVFVPNFLLSPTEDARQWTYDGNGMAQGLSGINVGTLFGAVNVPVPDQVKLTAFRLRGSLNDTAGNLLDSFTATLTRTPARLDANPAVTQQLAAHQVTANADPIDRSVAIPPDVAVVDLASFRYQISVLWFSESQTPTNFNITAFELDYQPV